MHELQRSYSISCTYQDHGLQKAGQGDLVCGVRCKDQRMLEDHVQRSHTKEGIAAKFKSEAKLAAFFDSKGIAYDRDYINRIRFADCDGLVSATSKGVSARPDFHLTEYSAKLGAQVLIGNDEYCHRNYNCDAQRMLRIAEALIRRTDVPVVYLRFNPHYYTYDGVTFDQKLSDAHGLLLRVINSITKTDLLPGLNTFFLNYDTVGGELKFFVDAKLAEGDAYTGTYLSQLEGTVRGVYCSATNIDSSTSTSSSSSTSSSTSSGVVFARC